MIATTLLNAFAKLTIVDAASTESETRFYVMATKDILFSVLQVIKEELPDVKDILVHTWDSKKSPNDEECQLEIIVQNKKKKDS